MTQNRQRNPWNVVEGLPTADDYNPDANYGLDVEIGDQEQTWDDYGLALQPVILDGEDTGRRLLTRNGKFVADVSDQYKVLPNERAVSVANQVAQDLGAVPFHDFDGDWYVQLDDHVFQNEERTRSHALYAWDDPFFVGGDEVQFGFAVHNSIDGSLAFQVGLFTFRHACANMVFMGVEGEGMSFDQREVIQHESHQHTKGLDVDPESLKAWIKAALTMKDTVSEAYNAWRDRTISVEEVSDLIQMARNRRLAGNDLPGWMADLDDHLAEIEEDFEEDDEQMPWEMRAKTIEANIPQAENVWDTYNGLTENIWHSDSTNDQSKRQKFKQVHQVMNPHAGGN
jgi:hypothetical protein